MLLKKFMYIILSKVVDEIRKKYMDNPPIGYSKKDISKMSDDAKRHYL